MNRGDDEILRLVRKVLKIADEMPIESAPLALKGSLRSFHRIRCGNGESFIFMRYDVDRRENVYYADLAVFLRDIGIPVPRILHHDAEKKVILMEDLGERDLWSCREEPWEKRRTYYFKILDIVSKLHGFRREDRHLAGVAMMEAFDAELYRWERNYFLRYFVAGFCEIELGGSQAENLEGELALLAEDLEDWPDCLIHRDLQSQNIMIRGDEPVLIDFQGMRCGNPFYDLGSLLYDPYVFFTGAERQELLDYHYRISAAGCRRDAYGEIFRKASVQRLMQALGAYGFLALKKNRREFTAFIPSGLNNLIEAAGADPAFRRLKDLAVRCGGVLAVRGAAPVY